MLLKRTDGVSRQFARCPGRAKRVAVLTLNLVMISLLLSACSGEPATGGALQSTVKTKRLEIVDDAGATRIVMTTIQSGRPSLTFVDKDGKDRAWLFLSEDGSPNLILIDNPRFVQMDKNGEIRAVQRLDKDGVPIFSLMDSSGKIRTVIRLDNDGSPVLELFDPSGNRTWSTP